MLRYVIISLAIVIGTGHVSMAEDIPVGQAMPLRVQSGRCECVLPTTDPTEKYYLILGSLSRQSGPHAVRVRTRADDAPISVPRADDRPDESWSARTRAWQDRLTRARQRVAFEDYPPASTPPRERTFHLFVKEHDFEDPAGYVAVEADLAAVGKHCLVYVDRTHGDRPGLQPTVADVVHTFDQEVYPRARSLGRVLDVDRDGRFAILFTGWLGKLSNGKTSLGGFVRGSDFYRDLAAPYGNRCDMMCLNTNLAPGPHLHALLAHEYTHAILFSEHVFGQYLPEVEPRDEEGWLNEGLSHLVEDAHGWSNLDYRISAFLNAPERYQLVVPDYYSAGLWRSPGHRGATYLFLRFCASHAPDTFMRGIIQSSLGGTTNLEVAAGVPFAALFRRWTIALALGHQEQHVRLRGSLGTRLLCGPRFHSLSLGHADHEARLAGTSAAFFLLHSPGSDTTRLSIEVDEAAELQATLIRLPSDMARLTLDGEVVTDEQGRKRVRLLLQAHDTDVRLEAAAWERLIPAGNKPEDTSFRAEQFGSAVLHVGEVRRIEVPHPGTSEAHDSWIWKANAMDTAGHPIAAWHLFDSGCARVVP